MPCEIWCSFENLSDSDFTFTALQTVDKFSNEQQTLEFNLVISLPFSSKCNLTFLWWIWTPGVIKVGGKSDTFSLFSALREMKPSVETFWCVKKFVPFCVFHEILWNKGKQWHKKEQRGKVQRKRYQSNFLLVRYPFPCKIRISKMTWNSRKLMPIEAPRFVALSTICPHIKGQ